jgi:hypothetical protein
VTARYKKLEETQFMGKEELEGYWEGSCIPPSLEKKLWDNKPSTDSRSK